MKVTLFTSNNHRHNYLINLLSYICDELWVVQECKALFTGKNDDKHQNKNINEKYFIKVLEAQNTIFKKEFVNKNNKNIKTLPILAGELSNLSLSYLDDFLKSDIYVVFGSSYIEGELVNFLIKQNHEIILFVRNKNKLKNITANHNVIIEFVDVTNYSELST